MKPNKGLAEESGFLSVFSCFLAAVILLLGSALICVAAREGNTNLAYQQETQLQIFVQDTLLRFGHQMSSDSDIPIKLEEHAALSGEESLLLHEENREESGRTVRIRVYGKEKDGYIVLTGTADSLLPMMRAQTRQRRLAKTLWENKEGHYVYCGRLP